MSTSSEYAIFFEVSQKGYAWWFPALGLLFVLIGWMIAKMFRAVVGRSFGSGPFLAH